MRAHIAGCRNIFLLVLPQHSSNPSVLPSAMRNDLHGHMARPPTDLLLRTTRSHLYPGSIVTLDRDAPRTAKLHPAVIEFADGSGTAATLVRVDDEAFELSVDAYVTQKRHTVAARRWLLKLSNTTRTEWRVAQRLAVA
ncbi:hypothetical protein AAB992_26670 [Burkholderia contaminans]|uniref:hypothetical protein n=1 Tax=Burkholderia contaminans TaxID=488447 RepID=UPI00241708CD|nr:hypothetical protein [Burkholderia contaminans]WFN13302.1 hypothetical protein LXE92_20335 [Burkholderia contaminans]